MARPISSKSLSELRTADFAIYRDQRLQTIKSTTLKRELTPIHHMFEVARVEWGLPIKENPLHNLQLKAPDQRRERRLQPGELDRIVKATDLCRNRLILPVILLALTTGMRRGELLALKWNDIDLARRLLVIREAKNGHCRTIPLISRRLAKAVADPAN
jgi:integrase